MPLVKVISGGQTGVDQAALRAALDCGLQIGGWCPPGRQCEAGQIPPEFPLQETEAERSPTALHIPRSLRTQLNVRDSDATLILRPKGDNGRDPGLDLTLHWAVHYCRPQVSCDPDDLGANDKVLTWLRGNSIHTLNVAGPSEGTSSGIGDKAYAFLKGLFSKFSGFQAAN